MSKKEPTLKYVASRINRELLTRDPDGNLVVRGLFTSDKMDMLGDVITRDATERAVPAFRQWGNIRYMHLPQPVGKVTKIGTGDGLGWNEVEFAVLKEDVAKEVENGLLPALSVGILVDFESIDFMADGGWKINDYLLAEISLVDHPANYDAVLSRSIDPEELRMPEKGQVVIIGDETDSTKEISTDETVSEDLEVVAEEEIPAEELEVEKDLDVTDAAEEEEVIPAEEAVDEAVETDEEEEVVKEIAESDAEVAEEVVEAVVEPDAELSIDPVIEEEVVIEEEEIPAEEAVESFNAEKAIADLAKTVNELTELFKASMQVEESETEEATEPKVEETKELKEEEVEDEKDEVVNRDLEVQETEPEVEEVQLTRREIFRGAIRNQLEKQVGK
jgi:hypothetical protein